MNVRELMDKIYDLRKQRIILVAIIVVFALIALIPSDVKELRKENGILKRYALRLEKQNAMKDKAFIKVIERITHEGH